MSMATRQQIAEVAAEVEKATAETQRLQARAVARFHRDMAKAGSPRAQAIRWALDQRPRIPRESIARAAGVSVSRLYQVADNGPPATNSGA